MEQLDAHQTVRLILTISVCVLMYIHAQCHVSVDWDGGFKS